MSAATDKLNGQTTYQHDPYIDPHLNWAGKVEGLSFEVQNVSLHVHERIDPKRIAQSFLKRQEKPHEVQLSLFDQPENEPPLNKAIDFYRHEQDWTNRLIAGDSLLVMNSLLHKEGMAGKVQMVYIDPPYGIKYNSNFQPFINKRDVKDGKDEDIPAEPEMIQAFRDTWELGILTYLRDRLLLAREMLNETGSCFVQISNENVHLVRNLMDEVFQARNFCSTIAFAKTGGQSGFPLTAHYDYLIWYAKDKKTLQYREIYLPKDNADAGTGGYDWIEEPDGKRRRLTKDEIQNTGLLKPESKLFALGPLYSEGGTKSGGFDIYHDGRKFQIPSGRHWKTTEDGIQRLKYARRLWAPGSDVRYVRYAEDFPCRSLSVVWDDTSVGGYREARVYVVQTAVKVIERCLLMTT